MSTIEMCESLKLHQIISVYSGNGHNSYLNNYPGWQGGGRSYCEIHPVSEIGGKQCLGAGQPLSKNQLKELLGLTSDIAVGKVPFFPTEILGWQVVLDNLKALVWIRPKIRTIYHRDIDRKIIAPMPGMIFSLENNRLTVFAVKGNRRPQKNSFLYHLPIWNIDITGRVCTGTCKLPDLLIKEGEPEKIIREWESVFFDSEFTHEGTQVYDKIDLIKFWKSLDGKKEFSFEGLLSTHKTVNDLL